MNKGPTSSSSSSLLRLLRVMLLFTVASKGSASLEKRWIPDLEWQTKSNWEKGLLPEIDGRVIFPQEMEHVVGLAKSGDLRLAEIDLSREGTLVLYRDGKLELSNSTVSNAKVARWLRRGRFFWSDPDNWAGTSVAAPHMERVPCREDDVVLPSTDRTISIHLPVKEVQVGSIRMSNKNYPYASWQWDDLQNQREFSPGNVKYSQYSCRKCLCQDGDQADYLEEICAIERPKCGFAACEYPLRVEGHCCLYCGGRISIKKGSLMIIRSIADEALEGYTEKLSWHVRHTWNGDIEILLKEKNEYTGISTIQAALDLKRKIEEEGIEALYVETAGASLKDSRLTAILGPLFGIPLVMFVLLIFAFSYFGYSYSYILAGFSEAWASVRNGSKIDKLKATKPFGFARFENVSEGNVQIADEMTGDNVLRNDNADNGESLTRKDEFENPLYRSESRKYAKSEERKLINVDAPLSLAILRNNVDDPMDEIEEIEQ